MNLFSISDLARFSGIKAHTIRIWEQRYEALTPARSEGNTRYYDGDQLRRLLNIVSLMNTGKKISQLGTLSDSELFTMVNKMVSVPGEPENSSEYFITQLIAACLTYDEYHFEKMFSAANLRFGLKELYVKIIHPLLQRIGLMWAGNIMPPPNEHFISNLIRQKIYSAIDALPPAVVKNEKWMLFLPEGEYHELGLLIANYLVRKSGRNTIYLGPDVPLSSIEHTLHNTNPTHLLTFFVHKDLPEVTGEFLKSLSQHFNGEKVFISIDEEDAKQLKLPQKFVPLHNVDQLEEVLRAKKKREKVTSI